MWFIALAFLGVGTVSAQTETAEGTSPWTREGNLGLKLTQVSLSLIHISEPTRRS